MILTELLRLVTSQQTYNAPNANLFRAHEVEDRKLYYAAHPPPSHLFPPHTMDNFQDEFIINTVEIVNVLNYCYFSVLSFLIYDSGTSQYSLNFTIYKTHPISSSFWQWGAFKKSSVQYWSYSFCWKVKYFWVRHILPSFTTALTTSLATA